MEDLEAMLLAERAGLFQTRRDLVFRKVQDTASLKIRRHNIARIMTVLNTKKREGGVAVAPVAKKAKTAEPKAPKATKTAQKPATKTAAAKPAKKRETK
jgi:large subunit ribosomal protein L29